VHSRSDRWNEIRDGIGLGALLVFAFFAWLGTGVAHAALLLMIVLIVTDYRAAWPLVCRDPVTRTFLLFLGYLLICASRAAQQWPETAHAQWAAVWPWISLWLFIPLAWWLKGRWNRIGAIMVLAPLGLMGGIFRRSDWSGLPQWLAGERYEFGYTALGISLLSLVIVIGLLAFLPRLVSLAQGLSARLSIALTFLVVLSFFLFILMVAQSRGAWFSLIVALLLLAGFAGLQRRGTISRRALPAVVLVPTLTAAAIVVIAAATRFGGPIMERVRSEEEVIPDVLTLDEAQVPYSPWGARIHLALWGLRLFARHPWLGFGPGADAPGHLLKLEFGPQQSGFLTVIEHFSHLHNAYLEILVRFGLLGSMLFAAGFFFVVRGIIANRRCGMLPADFCTFGWVVLLTILVFGCYEFRLLHTDFRFLTMLLGGIFYTHTLHRRPDEN
jgi:O-antigen ligase